MKQVTLWLICGLLLGGILTAGCGDKTEATKDAAAGKLTPEAESHEKQRAADMAKRFQKR